MSSPPRVSVLITSYNQEEYLREAIESAIVQTVKPHEIIIADDHSTKDRSVEIVVRYTARYPGWIRGVFQKKNVGIPRNRTIALQTVTGDHVTILDGDDRLLPRFVEAHLEVLAEYPEAGVSYSNRYDLDSEDSRKLRFLKPEPSGNVLAEVARGRSGILRSMLARYDLVRAAGFLDDRFYHHDGYVLTLRLASLTTFAYTSEPLMEKRDHPKSSSKGISITERIRCYQDLFGEVMRITAGLSSAERRQINEFWFQRILREKVLAEVARAKTGKALLFLAKSLASDPRRISASWKLARHILHRKPGHTEQSE